MASGLWVAYELDSAKWSILTVDARSASLFSGKTWTDSYSGPKNVGPFMKHLHEVRSLGYPFVVQHTITGYPRALEQAVVNRAKAVEHVRQIADAFGSRVCVWRYDTIVNSSLTTRESHLETFELLAKALEGATDEVVVSFAHVYRKTLRNVQRAADAHGFSRSDPTDKWKQSLVGKLAATAATCGIQLTVCSQPHLASAGCAEARCVDAERLAAVAHKPITASLKGNRKECGCFESRDIGEYDTCPHGCVYCYAVQNQELAKSRYKQHDPSGESLFPTSEGSTEATAELVQLDLFTADDDFRHPKIGGRQ